MKPGSPHSWTSDYEKYCSRCPLGWGLGGDSCVTMQVLFEGEGHVTTDESAAAAATRPGKTVGQASCRCKSCVVLGVVRTLAQQ